MSLGICPPKVWLLLARVNTHLLPKQIRPRTSVLQCWDDIWAGCNVAPGWLCHCPYITCTCSPVQKVSLAPSPVRPSQTVEEQGELPFHFIYANSWHAKVLLQDLHWQLALLSSCMWEPHLPSSRCVCANGALHTSALDNTSCWQNNCDI